MRTILLILAGFSSTLAQIQSPNPEGRRKPEAEIRKNAMFIQQL
jgi:hypothetical protein